MNNNTNNYLSLLTVNTLEDKFQINWDKLCVILIQSFVYFFFSLFCQWVLLVLKRNINLHKKIKVNMRLLFKFILKLYVTYFKFS